MVPNLLVGLSLDIPTVTPESQNFIPPTWPPKDDFPIIINKEGQIVSRYGDSTWHLYPWLGKLRTVNFGDGKLRRNSERIFPENARILRNLAASWLYTAGGVKAASTFLFRFDAMRPIFAFLSAKGITASELHKYPLVRDELPSIISSPSGSTVILILHDIWEKRELLGFYILDNGGIRNLAQALPNHEKSQTPYIPPRIWSYQITRLKECLDDFTSHREQIESCYHYCLDAYAKNCGSIEEACQNPPKLSNHPFTKHTSPKIKKHPNSAYLGKFRVTAERFGLSGLLEKWIEDYEAFGASALTQYFSFINIVGTAYVVNFSLMRIDETLSLRSDCLSVEVDRDTGDEIHLLRGETTKTISDDDACWITSPSVSIAVDAMATISKLRMLAAKANPDVPTTPEDISNPYLVSRSYEPWRRKSGYMTMPLSIRPNYKSFGCVVAGYTKLFDMKQMAITAEDLEIALLLTPTLDAEHYAVGKQWPLAWHQLRRTGAVNMAASGMVSDSSVQYQLKHSTRMMARYYMNGFFKLGIGLNDHARREFIRAAYDNIAREFAALSSDRFISPHGAKRKDQLLKIVSTHDHAKLVSAAKEGKIAYRPTIFGGCANPAHCPYGGIDNIAMCGGGRGRPACEHAIFDKEKLPKFHKLKNALVLNLSTTTADSPLHESLTYQLAALENAIHVIS